MVGAYSKVIVEERTTKWTSSGCNLKGEQMKFWMCPQLGGKGRSQITSKVSGLSNWRDGIASNQMMKTA
jgi:hypothetical protein